MLVLVSFIELIDNIPETFLVLQDSCDVPEHYTCYRKAEIPDCYHYKNNRRIGSILCVADEGWVLMERSSYEIAEKEYELPNHPTGAHGYDNQLESMRSIFIANGPAFKDSTIVEPFENIQVYNIIARILNLFPAQNDGGMEVAEEVLK